MVTLRGGVNSDKDSAPLVHVQTTLQRIKTEVNALYLSLPCFPVISLCFLRGRVQATWLTARAELPLWAVAADRGVGHIGGRHSPDKGKSWKLCFTAAEVGLNVYAIQQRWVKSAWWQRCTWMISCCPSQKSRQMAKTENKLFRLDTRLKNQTTRPDNIQTSGHPSEVAPVACRNPGLATTGNSRDTPLSILCFITK